MRLYTRYRPTRARRRPWRLWLALAVLGAGLYGWLRWEPRPREAPQDLLGRGPESGLAPMEGVSSAPGTAAVKPAVVLGGVIPTGTVTRPGGGMSAQGGLAVEDTAGVPETGRPVENLFEAQLALARQGLSPGSLDGLMGSRTRNALRAFQQRENLAVSGELNKLTRTRLRLTIPPYTNYTVAADDLARLLPVAEGWLGKSEQARLDYETILELVAERSWAHPDYLRRLNPAVDWERMEAGMRLLVPAVWHPAVTGKAAFVRIQLENRFLQVFDEKIRLIGHYPCTVARSVDRRPVGELRVEVQISMPNYTFDPSRFRSTEETRGLDRKLILPPGPNNPVGTVWIGLNRPGYGIHGTPIPEKVGGAESMGCFRLANWNAEQLMKLSWVGMPVYVEP